jgi:hypothetical protein
MKCWTIFWLRPRAKLGWRYGKLPTHDGLTCIWAGRSRDDWDTYRKGVERTYHEIIGLARWLEAKRARNGRGTSARGSGLTSNEIFDVGISGDFQAAEFGREGAIVLGNV